jgi:hypothetical protein
MGVRRAVPDVHMGPCVKERVSFRVPRQNAVRTQHDVGNALRMGKHPRAGRHQVARHQVGRAQHACLAGVSVPTPGPTLEPYHPPANPDPRSLLMISKASLAQHFSTTSETYATLATRACQQAPFSTLLQSRPTSPSPFLPEARLPISDQRWRFQPDASGPPAS